VNSSLSTYVCYVLWEHVTKMHSLSESYFLDLEKEAMPWHHRCVRGDPRQCVENHVNDKFCL
jgi:hypothetical protein